MTLQHRVRLTPDLATAQRLSDIVNAEVGPLA
jgi:hypothetical protein